MTLPGRSGILATAVGVAVDWLIEPADEAVEPDAVPAPPALRPVVVVAALAPGCGATTVARGLGAELASRDPAGACVVAGDQGQAGPRLGLPVAVRLANRLAGELADAETRAHGRLCLVAGADRSAIARAAAGLAPMVLDVSDPAQAGAAASLAHAAVLVAARATEPALAAVVADRLARVGPEPVVVLNRADAGERWPTGTVGLPETRLGAQLAAAGRRPRGELGLALAALADRCDDRGA